MDSTLSHELDHLLEACAESDWDGYGAKPVAPETAERVRAFLQTVPEGLPVPELSAEPDGAIAVEWGSGPGCLFSVSIAAEGDCACAWLNDGKKGHAVLGMDEVVTRLRAVGCGR